MQYIFGKSEKEAEKKIGSQITDSFKKQLKKEFCGVCQTNLATKVAFGKQIESTFTCQNCELSAVGGQVQRLGANNLISTEKLTEILAKELIAYQNTLKSHSLEHLKPQQNCDLLRSKIAELSAKIKEEYQRLKKNISGRHQEIHREATQQNQIPIFDEVVKAAKEKKPIDVEDGRALLKKALCNHKGLHFTDIEQIESNNERVNEKCKRIRKESRVRLKNMEALVDEINAMEL